jgi:hypothetical protein
MRNQSTGSLRWRPAIVACAVLLLSPIAAPLASADTISITGGSVLVRVTVGDPDTGPFPLVEMSGSLTGREFRLDITSALFDAPAIGLAGCVFTRCDQQQTIPIGIPIVMQGSLTLGGRTFPQVFNEGPIIIRDAFVTVPTGPFQLDSSVLIQFSSFGNPRGPVFGPVFLSGGGTFSLLSASPTEIRARYDFESAAPVPEPASILLLATGAAGIGARVRKRRSPAPQ